MTDSLGDILGRKKVTLPIDASMVRDYVKTKLDIDIRVDSKPKVVILYAANAGMAAHIRTYLHIIARDCGIQDKRLFIRIIT